MYFQLIALHSITILSHRIDGIAIRKVVDITATFEAK